MSVAIFVGKFSPIHKDHVKSILGIKDWCDANNAQLKVFSTTSKDKSKQPLAFDQKMQFVKEALEGKGIEVSFEPVTKIWDVIEGELFGQYKSEDANKGLYLFTGSDHTEEYNDLLKGILKRYEAKGRKIDFPVEVKPTVGRVDGVGISATDLRLAAKTDDYETFTKYSPFDDEEKNRRMFNAYKDSLKERSRKKTSVLGCGNFWMSPIGKVYVLDDVDHEHSDFLRDNIELFGFKKQRKRISEDEAFELMDKAIYELGWIKGRLDWGSGNDGTIQVKSLDNARQRLRRIDFDIYELLGNKRLVIQAINEWGDGDSVWRGNGKQFIEELHDDRLKESALKETKIYSIKDRDLQEKCDEVIEMLRAEYPKAKLYFIGGTARDIIFGNDFNDIDIATNLTKNEIMRVFPDPISANRFGAGYIVIIEHKGQKFDLDSIVDHDILEKIKTGDLTFNCMAVDAYTGEIFDPDGGEKDWRNKTLRFSTFVFNELRAGREARSVLRPFKFQSRWGWDFDDETVETMKWWVANGKGFGRVSRHNLQKIWDAIKSGPHAKKAIKNIKEIGIYDLLMDYETKKNAENDTKGLEKTIMNFKENTDLFKHILKEYDEDAWKDFRDRSKDHLSKDWLNKGFNRPAFGYHKAECEEIIKKINNGELDKEELEADEFVMHAMSCYGLEKDGKIRTKRTLFQKILESSGFVCEYCDELIEGEPPVSTPTGDYHEDCLKLKKKLAHKKDWDEYDNNYRVHGGQFTNHPRQKMTVRGYQFNEKSMSNAEVAKEATWRVLHKIKDVGNKGYLVGGAVRDHLMGKECDDYDIMTDMSKGWIGQKLGNVTGSTWRNGDEVLFVEIDGEIFDIKRIGRNRDFIAELEMRDLTMNAIAWDPIDDEYIDPTGGVEDIKNKVLAFTPKNEELARNGQQPARVLRFIRFYATTGFEIKPSSLDALFEFAKKVKGNFGIESENNFENNWNKLINGKNAENAIALMKELGLYKYCEEKFPSVMTGKGSTRRNT